MLRIWLDDERPAPEGWIHCEGPYEVIGYISLQDRGSLIEEISLDHDLGYKYGYEQTGYYVLQWLEYEIVHYGLTRIKNLPKLTVHSANPPAHKRMLAAIESIETRVGDKRRYPI